MRTILCKILLLLGLPFLSHAQDRRLVDSIRILSAAAQGHIGVLIREEGHQPTAFNSHDRFPLMSVFKFPLALYILDQVDKGKLSLDQRITIYKKDWPKMYSPLIDKYPQDTLRLTIRDLTEGAASLSDNIACDALYQFIGGPAVVDAFIHGLGIHGIHLAVTETQMEKDHRNIYRNWSTPPAMDSLLHLFHEGRILSATSTRLLTRWMTGTPNGPNRIKGLLPAGTVVTHKTGSADTETSGITPATNDVGIITLPNGHDLYVTVFVSDARADMPTREAVIARIARLAYNTFTK